MSFVEVSVDSSGNVYVMRAGERVYTVLEKSGVVHERLSLPAGVATHNIELPGYPAPLPRPARRTA